MELILDIITTGVGVMNAGWLIRWAKEQRGKNMVGVRLDEELILKIRNTERYPGGRSLTYRHIEGIQIRNLADLLNHACYLYSIRFDYGVLCHYFNFNGLKIFPSVISSTV